MVSFPGNKAGFGVDTPGGGDNFGGMEARVARLESDVAHIQKDVAEMKSDIREFRKEVSGLRGEVHGEISGLRKEVHSAKVWGLILFGTGYASLIAVMAKGFGWIK